jgi:hypothetical protein
MASAPSSSTRPHGSKKGDWERCSVSHDQLVKLQTQGFLPPADLVPVRAGLTSFSGEALAENFPNPTRGERVCFISYLPRGVGFPIHPFLRGLLEYYGLQLHNLTPASILHIAGFVALCELFLGCEAHFDLWRKLFCLVPRTQEGSIFEVGGAEVWRIAGTGYLSGTPKKASEEWPSEWFYIEDVALPDPIRMGLPEFSSAPLKKRHSWRPRSLEEEDSAEIHQLMSKIKTLAQSGLSIIEVMAISIVRGVQPLQFRGLPMWHYNGEDDASRCGRKGPDTPAALAKILANLYKGEKEEFIRLKRREGFSMYNPPSWVSFNPTTILNPFHESLLTDTNPSICNRNGERSSRGSTAPLHSRRTITGILTPDSRRIRTYLWSLRREYFTRRATMAQKWPL